MAFNGKKIAFVFPGQGAQYVGMAMDFISNNPSLLEPLLNFDRFNGTKLLDIMRNGPENILTETRFTQPAVLFHSIAAMRTLQEEIEIYPDYVAGHSLGEFSALVANGVLKLEDAMYLVHKRGEFMIKANRGIPFAMAAIIGFDTAKLEQICTEVSASSLVVLANYNTPEQTVISGTEAGVEKVVEIVKEQGAKRAVILNVGGPFHSPLIDKAKTWLENEMENIVFADARVPVIANVDAKPYKTPEDIKANLAEQITSSVRWVDSVKNMISLGVELFIEFGPKKVVAGMIKKIDRNANVMSIDSYEDLINVKKALELL